MTFRRIIGILTNRYVIVTLAFVVVILFIDQFNLRTQIKFHRVLKEQKKVIQYLQTDISKYQDSLQMVTETHEGIEKYAREKYFMKRDNEVVYKIVDKE